KSPIPAKSAAQAAPPRRPHPRKERGRGAQHPPVHPEVRVADDGASPQERGLERGPEAGRQHRQALRELGARRRRAVDQALPAARDGACDRHLEADLARHADVGSEGISGKRSAQRREASRSPGRRIHFAGNQVRTERRIMGQKTHPHGFRLGIIRTWDSKWFAEQNYANWLHEDIKLRNCVKEKHFSAGISRVEIERAANKVKVNIYTARPGIVIGKKGAGIEQLKKELQRLTEN